MNLQPEAWMDAALCTQTDPEDFFPEKSRSAYNARKVCAACDVTAQCLAYAIRTNQRDGIWGGTTPAQRAPHMKGHAA